MNKLYKPKLLAAIPIFLIIISLLADVFTLTSFNTIEYIRGYAPYSYLAVLVIPVCVYMFSVALNLRNSRKKFEGEISFDYSRNSGVLQIGEEEYLFDTKWTKASDQSIHVYSDEENIENIGHLRGTYEFPNANNFNDFFKNSSRSYTVGVGDIVLWRNKWGKHAAVKVKEIRDNSRGAEEDKLSLEYKIYN
ncbi:hypothetical protein B481_0584 [Planococcus halocryophilus Or1]|uniref:Uncharacterized protein n=1 Tax=Planococcus halocryophilus TaxID=1215089 RepID=A0A1C7DUB9_9BACL|nr:hypothetical protein [Planococcus halocryophilus]ANU15240.1 hypothetical protein BBI08_15870 [Planococcus halocryophilus]EMF47582.1 hypothetical protein B481_0584 [Planococcus halocryophilus Or1]